MLTPITIADAIRNWVSRRHRPSRHDRRRRRRAQSPDDGHACRRRSEITVIPSSDLGVPGDAKEAFAFALLAYEAYYNRPNNLPSATGAKHPTVLGKIIHAPNR